jgi:hypothetical protein
MGQTAYSPPSRLDLSCGVVGRRELPIGPVEDERAGAEVPQMNEHQSRQLAVETISCVECNVPWVDPSERWRVYLTDEDVPETVVYCHLCAEREFGSPFDSWS